MSSNKNNRDTQEMFFLIVSFSADSQRTLFFYSFFPSFSPLNLLQEQIDVAHFSPT